MVPAHELAAHAPLSPFAVVRVTRNFSVDRVGTELDRGPHRNTLAVVFPV
jgi:hypothetical protein